MSTNPQPPTLTIRDQMMNNFAKVLAALRAGSGLAKWDQAGILAALRTAWSMGEPADVLHAAINATIDPTNRTPAIIAMHGPHWARPKQARDPRPPDPVSTLPTKIATQDDIDAAFGGRAPWRRTPSPEPPAQGTPREVDHS
jgi:hypothetical protein